MGECKILYPPVKTLGGGPCPLSPVVYTPGYHCSPLEGLQKISDVRAWAELAGAAAFPVPWSCPPAVTPPPPVIVHAFIKSPSKANICPHMPCPLPPRGKSLVPPMHTGGGGGGHSRTVYLFTPFLPLPSFSFPLSSLSLSPFHDGEGGRPPP